MEIEGEELRVKAVRRAFKVLESRPVVRFVRDRRVLLAIVEGMSIRARVAAAARDVTARVAPALGLATIEDLRALERDIKHARGR